MAIIGPSFAEELTAAEVLDRRFTWGRDGSLEFHPEVPDTERQKVLTVLAAHDGPLSEARHQAMEAANAEAGRRIAQLFDQPPGSLDLVFAEINELAEALGIQGKFASMRNIRDARRLAKAAILGAGSVAEVQGVKPAWPAEAAPR